MSTPAGQTRIVVTGVGVVGPLGCGVEEVWKRLLAGRSGIRSLPEVFAEGTGVAVGGQVPTLEDDAVAGYDPERFIAPKDRKKLDHFIEFALVAAQEALDQAGWHPTEAADLDDFAHDFYSLAQEADLLEFNLQAAKAKNPDVRVQLQADNGVNYGEVARAMASIERAGITTLSVITAK
ncbi:3-oxoacyl-(acyl-carrier-protein) synthase [Pseudomonas frederiksbergensis]